MSLSPGAVVVLLAQVAGVLPPWMYGAAVLLLLVGFGLPRILRALDDRRVVRAAARNIRTERGALAALQTLRGRPARRGRRR